MESLIILIVIVVVTSALNTSKKKKEQAARAARQQQRRQTLEDLDSSPEEYVYDEVEAYEAKMEREEAPKPADKKTEMDWEDEEELKRYFGKNARPTPDSKPQQPRPELCEANPEVTPNADMQNQGRVEKELGKEAYTPNTQAASRMHVLEATVKPTEVILQPTVRVSAQPEAEQQWQHNKGLSPLQQGVLWSEILGQPVGKRRRRRRMW